VAGTGETLGRGQRQPDGLVPAEGYPESDRSELRARYERSAESGDPNAVYDLGRSFINSEPEKLALHTDDLNWDTRPYKPMDADNDSKLQVVPFSLELQRRLDAAGSPVRSVLAHPGVATTSLAVHSSSNAINRLSFFLNDPEHGALPTLYAATGSSE
jgi:hypothetical protein